MRRPCSGNGSWRMPQPPKLLPPWVRTVIGVSMSARRCAGVNALVLMSPPYLQSRCHQAIPMSVPRGPKLHHAEISRLNRRSPFFCDMCAALRLAGIWLFIAIRVQAVGSVWVCPRLTGRYHIIVKSHWVLLWAFRTGVCGSLGLHLPYHPALGPWVPGSGGLAFVDPGASSHGSGSSGVPVVQCNAASSALIARSSAAEIRLTFVGV